MRQVTGRQLKALVDEMGTWTGLFLTLTLPSIGRTDGSGRQGRIGAFDTFGLWSGVGDAIDSNGLLYSGVGDAMGFSGLLDAERMRLDEIAFTLSNIPENLALLGADYPVRGGSGVLSFGIVNPNGTIMDDLIELQSFECDNIQFVEDKNTSNLLLNCISGFVDITVPSGINWTKAAQVEFLKNNNLNVNDTGFDKMSSIKESIDVNVREGRYTGVEVTQVPQMVSVANNNDNVSRETDYIVPRR